MFFFFLTTHGRFFFNVSRRVLYVCLSLKFATSCSSQLFFCYKNQRQDQQSLSVSIVVCLIARWHAQVVLASLGWRVDCSNLLSSTQPVLAPRDVILKKLEAFLTRPPCSVLFTRELPRHELLSWILLNLLETLLS